jgi:hypothetical protein
VCGRAPHGRAGVPLRHYRQRRQLPPFSFFDLPAGDYDLTIEADGCETFKTKLKATPGQFIPPPVFRLILK